MSNKMDFKPLNEYVYEYLSNKITDGSLKPGSKIDMSQICKQLQISRTPLREVLVELANEGYIERLPRRGFIVREITIEKVKEIYSIIGCLEGFAARLAISRLTDDDLNELFNLTKQMDLSIKNKNYHEYYKLQRSFHDIYVSACGNTELAQLISSLKNRFMRQVYSFYDNERALNKELTRTNNQHKHILDLIKKGEKEKLEKHIKNVHWNLKYANLDSEYR